MTNNNNISNEDALARWAAAHHGVITMDVAREHQISEWQVTARLDRAQWRSAARGVYLVAGAPSTWQQRLTHRVAGRWAGSRRKPPQCGSPAPGRQSASHPPHHAPGRHPPATSAGALPPKSARPRRRDHRGRHRGDEAGPHARRLRNGVRLRPTLKARRQPADPKAVLGIRGLGRARSSRTSTRAQGVRPPPASSSPPGANRSSLTASRRSDCCGGSKSGGSPSRSRSTRSANSNGTVIAWLDLAWPESRVGFEYDGEEFHASRRWQHDEDRHDSVESRGWVLRHVDVVDLALGSAALHRFLTDHLKRVA